MPTIAASTATRDRGVPRAPDPRNLQADNRNDPAAQYRNNDPRYDYRGNPIETAPVRRDVPAGGYSRDTRYDNSAAPIRPPRVRAARSMPSGARAQHPPILIRKSRSRALLGLTVRLPHLLSGRAMTALDRALIKAFHRPSSRSGTAVAEPPAAAPPVPACRWRWAPRCRFPGPWPSWPPCRTTPLTSGRGPGGEGLASASGEPRSAGTSARLASIAEPCA